MSSGITSQPEPLQHLRREGAGRAVAAGGDDLHLARKIRPAGQIVDIARAEVLDVTIGAAARLAKFAGENDFLQAAHLVRAEGDGALRAHFHARPAIVVVRGRDHRHSGRVEFELREIGHRRQSEADVAHAHARAMRPATSASLMEEE